MTDQFDDYCNVNDRLFELQELKVFEDHDEARDFLSKHFKSGHFTLEGVKNGKRCIAVYVPAIFDGGIEVLDLESETSDMEFIYQTLPIGSKITYMSNEILEKVQKS